MKLSLKDVPEKAKRRVSWLVRDRLMPDRHVVRDVQGVSLTLPWSHRLPDYAGPGSAYGQNLVELARLMGEQGPLTVLDIGANVGDSALQILHAVDARVLCVEGDPFYLDFLHLNTSSDDRVSVVEALLAVPQSVGAATAVRTGGTTRFTHGEEATGLPEVTASALRAQHPDFEDLRLIKSDTDGYDVALVPVVAQEWAHSKPVVFFEYDPYLTRIAGLDPMAVWSELADLGYDRVAVWDNGGALLGLSSTVDVVSRAQTLAEPLKGRPGKRIYWDVAAVHAEDAQGMAALSALPVDSSRW
ncbi:hypothetical protein GCM10027020_36120 [Nocardioides salsibiostraticola]